MTGKAVEYLSALKSCGRAPVSRYTRRHCARRHAYGSARPSGRIRLALPHMPHICAAAAPARSPLAALPRAGVLRLACFMNVDHWGGSSNYSAACANVS